MAKPVCTLCEQNESILMATNLDSGDTATVCPADMLIYSLSMAVSATQGMTLQVAESVGELLDQIRANDPRPVKRVPRGRAAGTSGTVAQMDSVELAEALSHEKPATDDRGVYEAATGQSPPGSAAIGLFEPCPECGSYEGAGDSAKLVCAKCGAVIATADDAG